MAFVDNGDVQHDGVLGPARDPAQGLARLLVVAIPKQVTQPFNVDLSTIQRGKGRQLEGAQAAHDLLNVLHAHGQMEPVQDELHWAARGRAHQCRQRGVAVADRGDRLALPPALVLQRRTQQGMGPRAVQRCWMGCTEAALLHTRGEVGV